MKINFDLDIDVADRDKVLEVIAHVPASIDRDNRHIKHNSGVYVTSIPVDPLTGTATLNYEVAEDLGYIKIDFLNNAVYEQVRNEQHLDELVATLPDWTRLQDKSFFEQVVHIGNHYDLAQQMPEPVDSIPRMAMFLSIIRPGKRHLAGKTWKEVAKTIWDKPADGQYYFKRSHAVAYAFLVQVHINLMSMPQAAPGEQAGPSSVSCAL
jgi:hypothetical protein